MTAIGIVVVFGIIGALAGGQTTTTQTPAQPDQPAARQGKIVMLDRLDQSHTIASRTY